MKIESVKVILPWACWSIQQQFVMLLESVGGFSCPPFAQAKNVLKGVRRS